MGDGGGLVGDSQLEVVEGAGYVWVFVAEHLLIDLQGLPKKRHGLVELTLRPLRRALRRASA